jgi:hypothetical protein
MTNTPSVTLALTVHEPGERLVDLLRAQLPQLVASYAALTAFCSKTTHSTIIDLLRQHECLVESDRDDPSGIERIGEVRRRTVRLALRTGTTHLQMCDFDRALHWVAHYPEELTGVIAEIAGHDLLVLGRTERAWASHPPYQTETEPLFNRVFSLVTGLQWDVGAGSRGLSRRAAQILLETSQEMTVGIDAEWPLLLLRRDELRVGQRLCEGLEFETADRFGPEIKAAGGYWAWESLQCAQAGQWVFRLQVALMIAEAATRYGPGERKQ